MTEPKKSVAKATQKKTVTKKVAPKKAAVAKKEKIQSPFNAVLAEHCQHCGKHLVVAFIVKGTKMGFTCTKNQEAPNAEEIRAMKSLRRKLRKQAATKKA